MSNEEEEDGIKITLLGNPGVGKTCIISRYIDNIFIENNDSTIGANYSEKTIKRGDKEVQLNIWDTAGQEKFHSLGKHFYKDSYVVCLVYDITNQESLDSLKNIWYPDLQKYGEQYTILAVVGNKCDLYEMDNLAKEEQAKAFADEIKAIFMLTSAKTGDGIEKLFNTLTDKFLSPEFNPKVKEMIRKRGPSFSVDNEKNDKNFQKKCC
jgi:small GTP-binding protein